MLTFHFIYTNKSKPVISLTSVSRSIFDSHTKRFEMKTGTIFLLNCLVLVSFIFPVDGKPPHIIFIVADDLVNIHSDNLNW